MPEEFRKTDLRRLTDTAKRRGEKMNQEERRLYLIRELLHEQPRFRNIEIAKDHAEQKKLLRSLMNIRMAAPISEAFLQTQDEYLKEEIKSKGITDIRELKPVEEGIYLWQGDITSLRCDAIVNAANSGMTGCYQPCHNCIDKAAPTSITQVYNKRMARCS